MVKAADEEKLKIKLNSEYQALSRYLINHKMVVNEEKTPIMLINPSKSDEQIEIKIGDSMIKHQPEMTTLGIHLSDNLSMDHHIWSGKKSIIKSLNAKIALLRTLKPYLSTKDLANIGSSLINSTISYGAPIWGTTTKKNIDRLQKCQTRAARVIMSKGWEKNKIKTHRQTLFTTLGWPNVQQIVNTAIINLAKNAISQKSSNGINNMFKISYPKKPRLGLGARISHKGKLISNSKIFHVTAPSLFNQLPAQLRDLHLSKEKFKRGLKIQMNKQFHLPKH